MNLNDMSYTDYIKEVAIVIADDIEESINYSYTEKEKKELIEDLNNEDYDNLINYIQTYTDDIQTEAITILANQLRFEY